MLIVKNLFCLSSVLLSIRKKIRDFVVNHKLLFFFLVYFCFSLLHVNIDDDLSSSWWIDVACVVSFSAFIVVTVKLCLKAALAELINALKFGLTYASECRLNNEIRVKPMRWEERKKNHRKSIKILSFSSPEHVLVLVLTKISSNRWQYFCCWFQINKFPFFLLWARYATETRISGHFLILCFFGLIAHSLCVVDIWVQKISFDRGNKHKISEKNETKHRIDFNFFLSGISSDSTRIIIFSLSLFPWIIPTHKFPL